MRHISFEHNKDYSDFKIAILCKDSAFNHKDILQNYVQPLIDLGVDRNDLIAFNLDYKKMKKLSAATAKEYLANLLPAVKSLGIKYLLVTDAAYFKAITKVAKTEVHHGYVLPCKIKGYEDLQVVLSINYQALIYNPVLQDKLDLSISTLMSHIKGTYKAIGCDVIHSAKYPSGTNEIAFALEELHKFPELSCDIEGFSLSFNKAGIGTVAFAWDEHNGIAFDVEYSLYANSTDEELDGYKKINTEVRTLLRNFFESYKGKLTFHHASYDVKVFIHNLWIMYPHDTEGLLEGLHCLADPKKLHDTRIIAYLATNSTAGNTLGLKALAHEFAGNWAVEVKDIRKVPLKDLLQYNLIDALSTNYVKNKYLPKVIEDNQLELYEKYMMPSLQMLLQTELTGMPMNKGRIQEVKKELKDIQDKHLSVVRSSSIIDEVTLVIQKDAMIAANAKLKKKQHPLSKFKDTVFNPNSNVQLRKLLYDQMGLPVIDLTDTKQPATGAETIEKLSHHTITRKDKNLLEALIAFSKVSKILSTFIPSFEEAIGKGHDALIVWLLGNFNLGGTVSNRLSSSDPNLQNIPANSIYGKIIKSCFEAPKGWLFVGADFNSLEDMISALTTKDPNKLAVYTNGFDGHSLRAGYYFRNQCSEIDLSDPASVNTIKKLYPKLRQDSKAPTFLLTYGGTYHGMMSNLGWPKTKSIEIEKGYHDLYKVSDAYVRNRLKQASKDGYIEVAFGLRVRTPLLSQVVFGRSGMPYEAAAEGRTAGNALGQSYCFLNNRAAAEFMQKVWDSPYRLDIKPIALIHDAIYILIRDRLDVLLWANRELIKSMQWQELPELQHPTVKLGAELDIFWPNWASSVTIPNDADKTKIIELVTEHRKEVKTK